MSDLSSSLRSLQIDRKIATRPSRWWLKFAVVPLVCGVLAILAYALTHYQVQVPSVARTVVTTRVLASKTGSDSLGVAASGYVVASASSKVAPRVAGTVAEVFVGQGDRVKKGEVLLKLDRSDMDAAIDVARARAKAAQARASSADAQTSTARAQMQEIEVQLARERQAAAAGVSPAALGEDLEAKLHVQKTTWTAARAAKEAAEADVASQRAEVRSLEISRNNATLLAPIDGTVVNQPPGVGEYLGPQPAGISIEMGGIEIADLSSLVVEVDVPEKRLHVVRAGGKARVTFDAFPGKELGGVVQQIRPVVNRAKATALVVVAFEEPTTDLLPQMSARVVFHAPEGRPASRQNHLRVERSAVLRDQHGWAVYVVKADQVRRVGVEVGEVDGHHRIVHGDLQAGAQVVDSPPNDLVDGESVRVSAASSSER